MLPFAGISDSVRLCNRSAFLRMSSVIPYWNCCHAFIFWGDSETHELRTSRLQRLHWRMIRACRLPDLMGKSSKCWLSVAFAIKSNVEWCAKLLSVVDVIGICWDGAKSRVVCCWGWKTSRAMKCRENKNHFMCAALSSWKLWKHFLASH